jgi:hypothetical protein
MMWVRVVEVAENPSLLGQLGEKRQHFAAIKPRASLFGAHLKVTLWHRLYV